MLTKYPVFYSYLLFVLVDSAVLFCVYAVSMRLYARIYWYTEFIGVLVGCFVIWEIYTQTLATHPGTARVARAVFLGAVIIASAQVFLMHSAERTLPFPVEETANLDRNLRGIQGLFLVVIVFLLFYYSIPIGRNLKGMIAGYSVYIAASITSLAVRTYFKKELQIAAVAYTVSLTIWCIALWRYEPNPQDAGGSRPDHDSRTVASAKQRAIASARGALSKVARP